MRSWFVFVFLVGLSAVALGQTPAKFTDAQLLQAEKYRSAVLEYQLAKQALDARGQQLQQMEATLHHDLCGAERFDFATATCVKPPKAEPAK